MPYYRAFLIDQTGHVFAVRVLNSGNDVAALKLAGKIRTACSLIEVWNLTDKVGEIQPRNKLS